MTDHSPNEAVVDATRRWVELVVVGMNLCPFARREMEGGRVRFQVSRATTEEELLVDLQRELALLDENNSIETTLLIHPDVLHGFVDYNRFLGVVDSLLCSTGREGVYQVASFHPDYQFAGTAAEDAENYTNRSPYPMLHLLREDSLERAIASHPDPEGIPQRNIELMNSLGAEKLARLWRSCFTDSGDSPRSG